MAPDRRAVMTRHAIRETTAAETSHDDTGSGVSLVLASRSFSLFRSGVPRQALMFATRSTR
jgi:hypothetical protein